LEIWYVFSVLVCCTNKNLAALAKILTWPMTLGLKPPMTGGGRAKFGDENFKMFKIRVTEFSTFLRDNATLIGGKGLLRHE
jgi:hypothetical protein